jgi:hypothetical protein
MAVMGLRLRRIVAVVVLSLVIGEPLAFAIDSKGASYMGGSAKGFEAAKDPVDGRLNVNDQGAIVFTAEAKPFRGTVLRIPHEAILDLEYGQKAGRRVGAAVATTILLGPLGLLTLFSHKRKHYLTIGFKDADGKDQVAILELGKDIVRTTLAVAEAKSGRKIVYQDDEAKKSSKGQ